MKFTTSVLLFLCLFLTDATAQLSEGGTPISNRVNLSANIPVVTMPGIDAATLIEEDKRDIANNNNKN